MFERTLKEDLGVNSQVIFRDVDENPVGCASLAQVHHGHLVTGEEVAIKIQYPTVAKNTQTDLRNIELATRICERLFPRFQYSVSVSFFLLIAVDRSQNPLDGRARVQLPQRGGESSRLPRVLRGNALGVRAEAVFGAVHEADRGDGVHPRHQNQRRGGAGARRLRQDGDRTHLRAGVQRHDLPVS